MHTQIEHIVFSQMLGISCCVLRQLSKFKLHSDIKKNSVNFRHTINFTFKSNYESFVIV